MLISLIYVSTAVHLMSNEELLEILHISRKNNEIESITGMLLYKGGNFMQVLEGPEESVMRIFDKIKKDTKHKNLIVLSREIIKEREFSDWKMAFLNLDEESARLESSYSEFLRDEFTADKYRETPHLAYIMLLSFKNNMN